MEYVRVIDEERAKEWRAVLGTDTLPVRSIITERALLPIGEKLVFMLDIEKLTTEQRDSLITHLAEKFNLPREEVEKGIHEMGVPILADDCIASSDEIWRYL